MRGKLGPKQQLVQQQYLKAMQVQISRDLNLHKETRLGNMLIWLIVIIYVFAFLLLCYE